MMPNFLISVILLLVTASLILTLVLRYFSMKRQYEQPTEPLVEINGFTQRLARMIQIPTVSWTHRSKRGFNLF